MSEHAKIQPSHLSRIAIVYVRHLGLSGSTTHQRSGFARMTAEVALSHVGIILGLEVSRMARNNADWTGCWTCAR